MAIAIPITAPGMIRTGITPAFLPLSATTGVTPGTMAGVEITTTGTNLIAAAEWEWDYRMAGARAGMAVTGDITPTIPAQWSWSVTMAVMPTTEREIPGAVTADMYAAARALPADLPTVALPAMVAGAIPITQTDV